MNRFVPLLLGLGLLLAGTAAAQTTHVVTVSDFQFSPATLTIEAGDTVRWENVSGLHNVNGTTATFPQNPLGFGNELAPAPWNYQFTFQFSGDYDYRCDAHPAMMQGSITVNPASTDSPLIISEYVEGTSNNKALEIHNTSGSTVDLGADDYAFRIFFNGNPEPGPAINLTGSIAPGDVFVIAHSSADPAILAVADQVTGSLSFNGDDAIVLFQGNAVVDAIGRVGEDPGTEWGTGDTSTADNTLRRELNSCGPDTDPLDPFDPATIYSGFPVNTFDGLGSPGNLACFVPSCEQSMTATLDDDTPAPGQVITFTVTVTNNAASPAPLDLWLVATGPVNRTLRLGSGTLPAGATVTRAVRLRIPGNAPAGSYDLDLNIGTFPGDVCDTVEFTLTVSSAVAGGGTEFEVVEGFTASASAVAGAAVGVSPNPFARQTTIAYEVAAASDVRLAVYDVLGREVAVLVDRRVEAGAYAATFDGSTLAAGTYVYRLVVGNTVETGRMTLTR